MTSDLAALDAGVVIAWQTPEHKFHARSLEAIAAWPRLVMHTVNLAEVLAGLDRDEWASTIRDLHAIGCTIRDTTAQELAAAQFDGNLRMTDACVLAVARAQAADAVLTFDARLRRVCDADGFA
ncbi:MAG: type II toxin-antitoxin system VapC family toxin [Propionibacteriaceae bacterium]|nr:type II toxin-antitoxin system VapC family toxin [Propionibacteriaceae bacterium]